MAGLFYSSRFREYRKQAHQVLGTSKLVMQFNSVQEIEVGRFLLRTLHDPDNLIQHLRKLVLFPMSKVFPNVPKGKQVLLFSR